MTATIAHVDSNDPDRRTIERAAACVRDGLIVAYPTDTQMGLAVDPFNRAALERLYVAKHRDAVRAAPLIGANRAIVEGLLGPLPRRGAALAAQFWPGPLSLIVPAPAALREAAPVDAADVAVRVPASAIARGLARLSGGLITATSANRSGAPPARSAAEVLDELGAHIAFVLDAGPLPDAPPSTMVDVTGDDVRLVREGATPWERVLESLS